MTRFLSVKQMADLLSESVASADKELQRKTLREIQYETAIKWAGRALVAHRMGNHDDAHEYAHEAAEHAALTADVGLLDFILTHFRRQGIDF
jgi:hypothetical protein